jgi:hypothetical protein
MRKWYDNLDEDEKFLLQVGVVQYGGIVLLFVIAGIVYYLTR